MRVGPVPRDQWQRFVATAWFATLFHDLDFLAYHPAGRFDWRHLGFWEDDTLVAVLPGAIKDDRFTSTSGASVGGFAFAPHLRSDIPTRVVNAFVEHAKAEGWKGAEITIPPSSLYEPARGHAGEAAMFFAGFQLQHRWLCHALLLNHGMKGDATFKSRQRSYVNAARKKGAVTRHGGLELMDAFTKVFRDTYARHGVPATHTEDEIRDLLERLPDRVTLSVTEINGEPIAGLLVFATSSYVATTMYICRSADHESLRGDALVIADASERVANESFRYLDLGPSASDMNFNSGVVFFKESLGATGHNRDRYAWSPT